MDNIVTKPPSNWVSLEDVLNCLQRVKDKPVWWCSNSKMNYTQLRIDMRDQHCLIKDREGNVITLEELQQMTKAARED